MWFLFVYVKVLGMTSFTRKNACRHERESKIKSARRHFTDYKLVIFHVMALVTNHPWACTNHAEKHTGEFNCKAGWDSIWAETDKVQDEGSAGKGQRMWFIISNINYFYQIHKWYQPLVILYFWTLRLLTILF